MAFQNITYSPARSNYIPMPLDNMQQLFESKQKAYEENLAASDQLQMAVSQMKFLDAANPLKEEIVGRANSLIETVAKNDNAWEYARPAVRHLAKELATDERIRNATDSYQRYQAAMEEARTKDVSDFQRVKLKDALSQYEKEYTSGKNPIFQAPVFYEEYQLFKEVDDMLQGWKADATKKTVKNGVAYWDIAGESVPEEELRKYATKTLLSDPKYGRQVRDMINYQMKVAGQNPDQIVGRYMEEIDESIAKLEGDKNADPQMKEKLVAMKEALQTDVQSALRSIITNETLSGIVDPMAAKHSYNKSEVTLNKFDPYWLESMKFQFKQRQIELENRLQNMAIFEPNNPDPYNINRKQILSDIKEQTDAKRDLELRIAEARTNGDDAAVMKYQNDLARVEVLSQRKANLLAKFENEANINLPDMYRKYQQKMIRAGKTAEIVSEEKFNDALRNGNVRSHVPFQDNVPGLGFGSSATKAKSAGMTTQQFDMVAPFIKDYQNKLSSTKKNIEQVDSGYPVIQIIGEDKDKVGTQLQKGVIDLLRSGTVPVNTVDGQVLDNSEIFQNNTFEARMTGKTAENGSVIWEGRWAVKSGKNKVDYKNTYFTIDAPQVNPIINTFAQKNFGMGDDAYALYFSSLDGGSMSAALSGVNMNTMSLGEARNAMIPIEDGKGSRKHSYMEIVKESEAGYTVRMPNVDGDKVILRDNAGRIMLFQNESQIRAELGKRFSGNK